MATVQNNGLYGVSLQFKYKNADQWGADEILLAGEIGLEMDTKKYKLGDGKTKWSALAYYTNPAIDNAVSALTDRVTNAETNLQTLTGDMTQAKSDITAMQTKDTEQDASLQTLTSDMSTAKSDISSMKTKDESQDSSIEALQKKDTDHDTEITNLKNRTSALEGITVISANPAP